MGVEIACSKEEGVACGALFPSQVMLLIWIHFAEGLEVVTVPVVLVVRLRGKTRVVVCSVV